MEMHPICWRRYARWTIPLVQLSLSLAVPAYLIYTAQPPVKVVPAVYAPAPGSGAFWHSFAVRLAVQFGLETDAALRTMWNTGGCTFVLFVTACALAVSHWLRVFFDLHPCRCGRFHPYDVFGHGDTEFTMDPEDPKAPLLGTAGRCACCLHGASLL